MPNAEKKAKKPLKMAPNEPTLRLALIAMFNVVVMATYKRARAKAVHYFFIRLRFASILRPSQLLLRIMFFDRVKNMLLYN